MFEKLLPGPSELVQVTLPRPLGIVFEEDSRRGRAVVVEFVPDSLADRERKAMTAQLITLLPTDDIACCGPGVSSARSGPHP